MDVQSAHTEPHDTSYVQKTFPLLDSAMSQKLARTITRRRQYIKYRANRHRSQEESLELDEVGHARSEGGGSIGFSLIPQNIPDPTQTEVTTSKLPASDSSATSSDRSGTMEASGIRVKPLPRKDTGGRRLCQFCLMLISVETQDEWE